LSILATKRKALGAGIVLYFLVLTILFLAETMVIMTYGPPFQFLPFDLLVIEIILSLPAIPSSFITSYWSKNRNVGIFSVLVSGIIVILILSLIIGALLLIELLGPPPTDQWDDFARGMLVMLVFFFYLLFILPIAGISANFAVIFGGLGYKRSLQGLTPKDQSKLNLINHS
jgi:hypothetical protein